MAGVPIPETMRFGSLLHVMGSGSSGQVDPDLDRVFLGLEEHCGRYPRRAVRTKDHLFIRNYETHRR
jgi:hypothetical protein